MTPEFASLVNPTFHNVLALVDRLQRGDSVDLAAERARIRNEIEDAEMTCSNPKCSVKDEDFRIAKQGLVYWIDEVMTRADRKWLGQTFEWDYYESNDRAWKFYVDGEQRARKAGPDVCELWYLALVLGFEGDIENAFDEHMHNPLPPDQTPEQARQSWAMELARQIRQQKSTTLSAPALEGDVRPLESGMQFSAALRWLGGMGAALVVLLLLKFVILHR